MRIDDLGRAGRYEELRQLLRQAPYTEASICEAFGLRRVEDFELDSRKRAHEAAPQSPAALLATLFLAGRSVPAEAAARLLGPDAIPLLEAMCLIETDASGNSHATLALYPVADVYIASDRWSEPGGGPLTAPEDVVYPAFIPNTRLFLRHLPAAPRGRLLDVCGGTGVGALLGARHGAAEAWSADIAERSTRFAEFNRLLNRTANVRNVSSDVYDAIPPGCFDLITAHPPYVPALQPRWIFFSGGSDGEEITRRIVAGLPERLNDGGVFLALTMGSDRAGQPFETRVREWLGPRASGFDVALIVRKELDPREFAMRANRDTIRSREEAEAWDKLFQGLRVETLVYGFVIVQRRTRAKETFTIRRQAPANAARAPWEWLLSWEAARTESPRVILEQPLHASRRTDFHVLHRLGAEGWNPASYALRTDWPFPVECEAQPWMAHLLSLCDGRATGREILAALQRHAQLPAGAPEDEFARAAASLVSGGFLEVEGLRPPRAEG